MYKREEEEHPPESLASRAGLIAPVLELAEKLEDGSMTPAEYRLLLSQTEGRFLRLQERMLQSLESQTDLEAYRGGLKDSLTDSFEVLKLGLREMALFRVGRDRRPLRMGRLLLEKGEQEYLAVLEILQTTPGSERERTLDLWGQLLAEAGRAASGHATQADLLEALAWGEWAMGAHMNGTTRDFQRALGLLRANPGDPGQAQDKVQASLRRLSEFLGLSISSATTQQDPQLPSWLPNGNL